MIKIKFYSHTGLQEESFIISRRSAITGRCGAQAECGLDLGSRTPTMGPVGISGSAASVSTECRAAPQVALATRPGGYGLDGSDPFADYGHLHSAREAKPWQSEGVQTTVLFQPDQMSPSRVFTTARPRALTSTDESGQCSTPSPPALPNPQSGDHLRESMMDWRA